MSFKQLTVSQAGQEVQRADLNTLAEAAAHSDDYVFAQLFRPSEYEGSLASVTKAVTAPGKLRRPLTYPQQQSLVASGVQNGKVYVAPFRALIGSHAAGYTFGSAVQVRSCEVAEASVAVPGETGSNYRVDLIYVQVTVDSTESYNRYVRNAFGVRGVSNVAVFTKTTAVIARAAGTPDTSPELAYGSKGALPADTSSTFNIPLAYLYVRGASLSNPYVTSAPFPNQHIQEIAPVLVPAPAAGGSDVAPARFAYDYPVQRRLNALAGDASTGYVRLRSDYFASTAVGKVERFFHLAWHDGVSGTPPLVLESIPENTAVLLDDTIDWRNRLFKITASLYDTNSKVPGWSPVYDYNTNPVFPDYANPQGDSAEKTLVFTGQSVRRNRISQPESWLLILDSAVASYMASKMFHMYVDQTNGNLMCHLSTGATCHFGMLVFVEAYGPVYEKFGGA